MNRPQKLPLPKASALWRMVREEDFIDGYAVESHLSPREAMKVGLSMPGWAKALLRLRNLIVAPFGLKTDTSDTADNALFPVSHEDNDEIIVGVDDQHLNFRIAIRQQSGRIHMATWVQRNNLLGRLYLAVVMPFHILIVRDSMRRIARASLTGPAV
ncbi:MAG: DUF2867 domain-containing protein [Rhodobacteraceae bacterium]|nr:DUF2867 domain-containing protein [Paracoccaceae bacterium]